MVFATFTILLFAVACCICVALDCVCLVCAFRFVVRLVY